MTRRILALGHAGPAFTTAGACNEPQADDGGKTPVPLERIEGVGRRTKGAAQPGEGPTRSLNAADKQGARVQAEDVTGGESPATYQLTGEDIPSPIDEVPAPALGRVGGESGRARGRVGVGVSVLQMAWQAELGINGEGSADQLLADFERLRRSMLRRLGL